MQKSLAVFVLYAFLFDSIDSFGQKKFILVDQELNSLKKEHLFNGSLLVAKAGKVIYQNNIGYADIEHKVPIARNTKFEVASITKTFTAILVLQLVEEFMDGLQKTSINFKPGAKFEYASSTYVLLRFIIEKVTGKSYEANLKESILNVAGMTTTGIIHNHEILNNRALGYLNADGNFQNALPIANHEIFIGASSIYSTADDLLKFDQALYTDKLLKQKEKEQMYTIVEPPYGYGWFISDDSTNGKIVSHGGDLFGYTSLFERRLKDKTAIIILSNLQGVDREKIVNILNKTALK